MSKIDLDIFKIIAQERVEELYLPELISKLEKEIILEALKRCRGNAVKASEMLGIHRNSLNKKIREHGIQSERKSFRARRS